MAKKEAKTTNKEAKTIIDTPANEELSHSFLEYSMSVVYSRAIPSIDGFKPVQRRILYGMYDAGWTADKNFVKVSRVAGEVMGKLHPHGDSSISDALVKLAQPFYSNVPFVEGYGNFGDISGSGAAAARYIESKLSKAADFVLPEIKEGTVPMKPNYDDTSEEPTLLPIRFPVLLVNGNFGIGVGFSNKMPSHNLNEVIDGTKYLLKKPSATLEEVMKYIPGPDFPTGAEIIGVDGIEEAYSTGQGVIRLRAKHHIEPIGRGKYQIVFTELPYGVKTESIITKIKDSLKLGKFTGLADASDLTDRQNGLKVVIETKAGTNPQAVLAELYKETALEDSFGINFTVLVDGKPKVVGLLEMLQIFIDFRKDIILKRSAFRKQKRADRLHIVEGLLKALANIDDVIKIVRNAENADVAQKGLIKKFKVDEIQADYILGIALRRLTKFDSIQLNDEKDKLLKEIAELDKILNDEATLKRLMNKELDEVKKALGSERKSVIVGGSLAEHLEEAKTAAASTSVEIKDEPCVLSLHASGSITRSPQRYTYTGRGKIDPIVGELHTTTRSNFVAVTNKGNAYRIEGVHTTDGAQSAPKDLGVSLGRGERFVALGKDLVNGSKDSTEAGLALGTKGGVVKIVNSRDYPLRSDEFPAMTLEQGDEIIGGAWVADAAETDFVFIASNASLLRFEAAKVRPQGSKGAGVAGFKVAADASVLGFFVLAGEERNVAEVITYTGTSIKRSKFDLFPTKGRGTGGVRSHTMRKGESGLVFAHVGTEPTVVNEAGKKVDLPAHAKRDASGSPAKDTPVLGGRK